MELRLGYALSHTSAWISTLSAREPSIVIVIAEPLVALPRVKNLPATSLALISPFSLISKIPTSLVEPNRFLNPRSIRSSRLESPSKYSTTSTMCSKIRGPAIEPSFVIWPMIKTQIFSFLAKRMSSKVISRTCDTEPGAEAIFSL